MRLLKWSKCASYQGSNKQHLMYQVNSLHHIQSCNEQQWQFITQAINNEQKWQLTNSIMCVMWTIIQDNSNRLQAGSSSMSRINMSTFLCSFFITAMKENQMEFQNYYKVSFIITILPNSNVHICLILSDNQEHLKKAFQGKF